MNKIKSQNRVKYLNSLSKSKKSNEINELDFQIFNHILTEGLATEAARVRVVISKK